jgi:hypothetical protein
MVGLSIRKDLVLLYSPYRPLCAKPATSDKRVLAFGITCATYQLSRARKWSEARRLTLEAITDLTNRLLRRAA